MNVLELILVCVSFLKLVNNKSIDTFQFMILFITSWLLIAKIQKASFNLKDHMIY